MSAAVVELRRLARSCAAVKVEVCGRKEEVEAIVAALCEGRPLDVTTARAPQPVDGRGRGDRTVAAHLDVRAA